MEWRDIPGFEGYYMARDDGRLLSLGRETKCSDGGVRKYRSKWMRPTRGPDGYLRVSLRMDGKYFHRTVHSLIALTFIGPRPPKLDVAHGNGIKTDNRAANLRYATKKENMQDSIGHGAIRRGDTSPVAKINSHIAKQIRAAPGLQAHIAEMFGVSQSLVSQIKLGKVWVDGKFSLKEIA